MSALILCLSTFRIWRFRSNVNLRYPICLIATSNSCTTVKSSIQLNVAESRLREQFWKPDKFGGFLETLKQKTKISTNILAFVKKSVFKKQSKNGHFHSKNLKSCPLVVKRVMLVLVSFLSSQIDFCLSLMFHNCLCLSDFGFPTFKID